jgi:hypothetical protein
MANAAPTTNSASNGACHGTAGSDSKRGIVRSHGSMTMSAANIVSMPARNQNRLTVVSRFLLLKALYYRGV